MTTIVVIRVNADDDKVNVYDSVYHSLDKDTTNTIHNLSSTLPNLRWYRLRNRKVEKIVDCFQLLSQLL